MANDKPLTIDWGLPDGGPRYRGEPGLDFT